MERQTVLIVDDSELNRMMLMEILGEQYHYIEASDGREAVRLMEKKLTVDLMLLDINMPEMNGFQVLEQMNRFRWIDEIPVIMISTDETNQAIQQAYAMGVTDYIRRPFDTFIVRRRVENTLKLYANQKRLMHLVSDQIREKEENSNLMVGILSHVVEFRNHEGGDHIRNIRGITELLLRQLVKKTEDYHLSEEDIALIKTASALHDIGKITIPEEILNKPGKLTSEEFAVMKTHAAAGAVILEQMTFGQEKPLFRYALEICRWHHERWDGHGYPDGLRGERIPIAAQVVALADVYNALTSERCYKKAFDHDTAIAMILGGECGAFNPLLLECLVDVSPRLRITSHVPMDGDPYRLEVDRLSDELLARTDLPRNDRVQRMLESLQERIDFFASCSGGIQFEFDALSGLADITNWDEPPQHRHTVKNAAHPECFCRLSQKDFHQLQEAMDATTKETPEFSVSLLLPCGTEHHWCDLRVRPAAGALCGRRGSTGGPAALRQKAAAAVGCGREYGGRHAGPRGGDAPSENGIRCCSPRRPHYQFRVGIGRAGRSPSQRQPLRGLLGQRPQLRQLHFLPGTRPENDPEQAGIYQYGYVLRHFQIPVPEWDALCAGNAVQAE